MGQEKYTIQMNYEAFRNQLIRAFHRVTQHVAMGLRAVEKLKDGEIDLPGTFFSMDFGSKPRVCQETKEEFTTWLLGVGLREALEVLETFSVDVRYHLALHSIGEYRGEKPTTAGEILQEIRASQTTQFAKNGWPDKIQTLRDEFSFNMAWEEELLSINKARNCLTHRRGVVDRPDVNDKDRDQLVVRYREIEIFAKAPDGSTKPVRPGEIVEAGHGVYVRTGIEREKRFDRGDRVSFTAQVFVHLTTTLYAFADRLIGEAIKHGQRMGVPRTPREQSDLGDVSNTGGDVEGRS